MCLEDAQSLIEDSVHSSQTLQSLSVANDIQNLPASIESSSTRQHFSIWEQSPSFLDEEMNLFPPQATPYCIDLRSSTLCHGPASLSQESCATTPELPGNNRYTGNAQEETLDPCFYPVNEAGIQAGKDSATIYDQDNVVDARLLMSTKGQRNSDVDLTGFLSDSAIASSEFQARLNPCVPFASHVQSHHSGMSNLNTGHGSIISNDSENQCTCQGSSPASMSTMGTSSKDTFCLPQSIGIQDSQNILGLDFTRSQTQLSALSNHPYACLEGKGNLFNAHMKGHCSDLERSTTNENTARSSKIFSTVEDLDHRNTNTGISVRYGSLQNETGSGSLVSRSPSQQLCSAVANESTRMSDGNDMSTLTREDCGEKEKHASANMSAKGNEENSAITDLRASIQKRIIRARRNRESADRSRKKRKALHLALQAHVDVLSQENTQLRAAGMAMQRTLAQLGIVYNLPPAVPPFEKHS